jgi:hypothetical protein
VLVRRLRIEVLEPDAASRRAAKLFAIFHEVIVLDLIDVVNCLLVILFGPTFRKRFADEYNSLCAEHRP